MLWFNVEFMRAFYFYCKVNLCEMCIFLVFYYSSFDVSFSFSFQRHSAQMTKNDRHI